MLHVLLHSCLWWTMGYSDLGPISLVFHILLEWILKLTNGFSPVSFLFHVNKWKPQQKSDDKSPPSQVILCLLFLGHSFLRNIWRGMSTEVALPPMSLPFNFLLPWVCKILAQFKKKKAKGGKKCHNLRAVLKTCFYC